MTDQKLDIVDFPKHYLIDEEGFLCFVNDAGERTRIARILRNGNIETVGKTRISDPYAQKKRHFFVKTFFLFFLLFVIGSAGTVFFLYQESLKQKEEYLKLKDGYDDAVSEVVLGCKSELKKIEDFINDQEEHKEDEIEELIKKLRNISPNYCQGDTELYPKFTEFSRALYVMKGKIGGKREAEEKQKKELERQLELERQQELERIKREEEQKKLEAEQKKREEEQKKLEAEQKKREEEARRIEKAKREKEELEKRKKEEKNKAKKKEEKGKNKVKTTNNNKKKSGEIKNQPRSGSKQNTAPDSKQQKKKVVKTEKKAEKKSETQNEAPEDVSALKRGIDKLEEWLKNLKR